MFISDFIATQGITNHLLEGTAANLLNTTSPFCLPCLLIVRGDNFWRVWNLNKSTNQNSVFKKLTNQSSLSLLTNQNSVFKQLNNQSSLLSLLTNQSSVLRQLTNQR